MDCNGHCFNGLSNFAFDYSDISGGISLTIEECCFTCGQMVLDHEALKQMKFRIDRNTKKIRFRLPTTQEMVKESNKLKRAVDICTKETSKSLGNTEKDVSQSVDFKNDTQEVNDYNDDMGPKVYVIKPNQNKLQSVIEKISIIFQNIYHFMNNISSRHMMFVHYSSSLS
jgi:hypothetical protein